MVAGASPACSRRRGPAAGSSPSSRSSEPVVFDYSNNNKTNTTKTAHTHTAIIYQLYTNTNLLILLFADLSRSSAPVDEAQGAKKRAGSKYGAWAPPYR